LYKNAGFSEIGGEGFLAFVILEEGENLESALRRFKRRVQQEAIIKEIKKHSVYFKPGERRRMKEAQARKRMRRRIKRERDIEY
jgi:small subunit ribosomal protein S21